MLSNEVTHGGSDLLSFPQWYQLVGWSAVVLLWDCRVGTVVFVCCLSPSIHDSTVHSCKVSQSHKSRLDVEFPIVKPPASANGCLVESCAQECRPNRFNFDCCSAALLVGLQPVTSVSHRYCLPVLSWASKCSTNRPVSLPPQVSLVSSTDGFRVPQWKADFLRGKIEPS